MMRIQWYGATVESFQTVGNSFASLWSAVKGSPEFVESTLVAGRGFAVLLTTSFCVVVALFFYAPMLATLSDTFAAVRRYAFHYSASDTPDYEMGGFLVTQMKKWLGVTKPKPVQIVSNSI